LEGKTRCNGCDLTRRELTIARERSGRGNEVVDKEEKRCCERVVCAKY
jgi:hypothetical protein